MINRCENDCNQEEPLVFSSKQAQDTL